MTIGIEAAGRFLALMKRYCIDYVNVGDQSVTKNLMVEDYLLRMGDHEVVGRDTNYHAATAQQMRQYPGLLLTVHEMATSGDRLMMRFSEHGRRAKDGLYCAWGGIGLYRWNGEKLVHNNVEQDYFSRRRQIAEKIPDIVDHPAIAPFNGDGEAPVSAHEAVVRAWLESGGLSETPGVHCDEAWQGKPQMRAIEQDSIAINDLFSVGNRVAFHVTQTGRVAPDFGELPAGTPAKLHAAGIVHVEGDAVASGRVIRNRMDMMRSAPG